MSGPIPGAAGAAYQVACDRLADVPGCDDLDGRIISLEGGRDSEPALHLVRPGLPDKAGALHRAQWLAGHCVVLHGPEPADIVSAPTWAEHNAYAVLNACRILRSLAEKHVVQSRWPRRNGLWGICRQGLIPPLRLR